VVADIVRVGSDYELVGFLDDFYPERHEQRFCDATVLGGREQMGKLMAQGIRHVILALGDNAARRRIATEFVAAGYVLGQAVHPRATLAADVRIGGGAVLMAGAVVNPNATLGENVDRQHLRLGRPRLRARKRCPPVARSSPCRCGPGG